MAKIQWEPRPLIYPLPVALVTCLEATGGPNVLTVSWLSPVCATPPLVGISLRPHRYSTQIIQETGEFTINIPTYEVAYEVDLCGTLSGKDGDKFRIAGFTEVPSSKIKAPLLAECAVSMECRTHQTLALGSHILFIGEVVALHVDEDLLSPEDDDEGEEQQQLELTRAKPLLYAPQTHDYWIVGDLALYQGPSAGKKP